MFDNWRSGSLEDATKEFMRLRRGRLEKGKRKKKALLYSLFSPVILPTSQTDSASSLSPKSCSVASS